MYQSFTTLMALGMAAAAPFVPRQDAPRKLLIGTPAQIITADFTGASFTITTKSHQPQTAPSWMIYREPNLVYAVNENGAEVNLFTLDGNKANPTLVSTATGTTGVVSLDFNEGKTRIVGASYGTGSYDVWDVQQDNSLKLLKNVKIPGPPAPGQETHRAHQALLDPSGRFFVIPNLGGDSIIVVDSENDSYAITNTVDVGAGSGPRHGDFVSLDGGSQATHYIVATENSNQLVLFALTYTGATIEFAEVQRLSTYGPAFPPKDPSTAAAGELVIADNGRDVYVSNRLSGNETDSIAHFALMADNTGVPALHFVDSVSSGGILPRMFSLGKDAQQEIVFVANQGGKTGVAALKRCPDTGSLTEEPLAALKMEDVIAEEFVGEPNVGPQFIQEI
ncbi:hypothetical protein DL771_006636 [Monosporascus sp. 5C6A]|nr:hypothetical protein DL771_006636 [Monosporascus sp. 5C6A]